MNVMLLSMKYVLSLKEYLENDVNLPEETLRCYALPMLPLHQSCSLDWRFWWKERASLEGLVEPDKCSWWARVLWARHTACIGAQMKTALTTISPSQIPESLTLVLALLPTSSFFACHFHSQLLCQASLARILGSCSWFTALAYPLVSSPSNLSALIEESSYQSSLEAALVGGRGDSLVT